MTTVAGRTAFGRTVFGRSVFVGATVASGPDWVPHRADVLIDGDRIAAVEPPGVLADVDATIEDATGCLLIPGLINAHTHSHTLVARGAARDWTLEASLLNGGWMAAERTEELAELSAVLAAAEMMSAGATGAFDLVAQSPTPAVDGLFAAARGYARAGLRVRLAPMVADRTVFDAVPAIATCCGSAPAATPTDSVIAACRTFVEQFPVLEGVSPALAPTIPSHCSPRLTAELMALAEQYDAPLHLHLAESKPQALASATYFGHSITSELERRGLLSPRLVAAHGIWLDASDIELLGSHGVTVVTVPGSNLRLGSGVAATRHMIEGGVHLAIGTDGANSADALDMLDAARLSSLLSRIHHDGPHAWLSVEETLDAATVGGARACGWQRVGRIEPGQLADLVLVDLGGSAFCPPNDLTNQLLTAARAADVRSVVVGGRFRMRDRAMVDVDLAAARSRFVELAAEFHTRVAEHRRTADAHVAASADALDALRHTPWTVQRLIP